MTIRWHVDDLMISHLSQDKIMKVVQGKKDIDKDNWGKLVRVLTYLNGTRYMKLILSADKMKFTLTGTWMGPTRSTKTAEDKLDA